MTREPRPPSPLDANECLLLEQIIAKGVIGADAAGPCNIPGWVYAGESKDCGVTLVVFGIASDNPYASAFAESLLSRICALAELMFGARTIETEAPDAPLR